MYVSPFLVPVHILALLVLVVRVLVVRVVRVEVIVDRGIEERGLVSVVVARMLKRGVVSVGRVMNPFPLPPAAL